MGLKYRKLICMQQLGCFRMLKLMGLLLKVPFLVVLKSMGQLLGSFLVVPKSMGQLLDSFLVVSKSKGSFLKGSSFRDHLLMVNHSHHPFKVTIRILVSCSPFPKVEVVTYRTPVSHIHPFTVHQILVLNRKGFEQIDFAEYKQLQLSAASSSLSHSKHQDRPSMDHKQGLALEQPHMVFGCPSCKPGFLMALVHKFHLLFKHTVHILAQLLFQLLDLKKVLYKVFHRQSF